MCMNLKFQMETEPIILNALLILNLIFPLARENFMDWLTELILI